MTNTDAWFALVGALGGIVLTGGITLTSAVLNHRWSERASERSSHEQEAREIAERLRGVFHDYLVATNAYYHAVHQMHELGSSRGDNYDKLARAYDIVLYALRDAAVNFDENQWSTLRSETHQSREKVRKAMRAERGVED